MSEAFSERVTVPLPKSAVRKIKRLAKARTKKPTELYREAIAQFLKKQESKPGVEA